MELLDQYRNKNCEICGKSGGEPHHIKSTGSCGRQVNKHENLVTLCREHHTEIHSKGINSFIEKHPKFKEILISKYWEYDRFFKKWFNSKVR